MKRIGLDIGSGSINAIVLDENIKKTKFLRASIKGNVVKQTLETLEKICDDPEYKIGVSGVNGILVSSIAQIPLVLDAVAVLKGIELLHPDAGTVFDIGKEGSSAYFIRLEDKRMVLDDFSANYICSAGGGALMEKMSNRLQFNTLDEFVEAAVSAKTYAKISGRCSVFAESDIVHHFQRGAGAKEIAAGLCDMLAKNFVTKVCRGKEIKPPVYIIGGVAKNKAVVKFLEQELGHSIIVPEDFLEVKAFGSAYLASVEKNVDDIANKLISYKNPNPSFMPPLRLSEHHNHSGLPYEVIERNGSSEVLLSINKDYKFHPSKKTKVFLGLDVGSVSTKIALIDEHEEFILGIYERTGGKPIGAVVDVTKRIGDLEVEGEKIKELVDVLECGTTGSGRDVAAKIIGAGIVKNEITAQASGATYFYPDVRIVFEIGGQDSKYILIDKGVVVDNEMNKVCAASTGSFLEEQAKILGINIKNDFERNALMSEFPCQLSEKCAVFMSSSLLSYQDSPLEDKCAGLAYSTVLNYLNRVAKKDQISGKIVFQGAVAFNKAVVAASETLLNEKIYVPKYPHLTGAIGVARIAKKFYENRGKNGI